MAKTSVEIPAPETEKVAKKERLRQAKREAKLLLRRKQARAKVLKAEKKIAKNQSKLDITKNNVSALEEQLAQMKRSSEESE